jgi:hypothetical protein
VLTVAVLRWRCCDIDDDDDVMTMIMIRMLTVAVLRWRCCDIDDDDDDDRD